MEFFIEQIIPLESRKYNLALFHSQELIYWVKWSNLIFVNILIHIPERGFIRNSKENAKKWNNKKTAVPTRRWVKGMCSVLRLCSLSYNFKSSNNVVYIPTLFVPFKLISFKIEVRNLIRWNEYRKTTCENRCFINWRWKFLFQLANHSIVTNLN